MLEFGTNAVGPFSISLVDDDAWEGVAETEHKAAVVVR